MPLFKSRQINPHAAYSLWHITEELAELEALSTDIIFDEDYNRFHTLKKKEYLSTRIVINQLLNQFDISDYKLLKDYCGKPYVLGRKVHISISHAYPYAVGLINTKNKCGIDIEQPGERILRIADKFLNSEERNECGTDIHKLTTFWCAKEALYKLYGKKGLSFKDDLEIEYPELTGHIYKTQQNYSLMCEQTDNYILVYSCF